MNISVKNVDETAFRKLKATAAELNRPVGAVLTDAINAWVDKNRGILAGIEEIVQKAKTDKNIVAIILFGSYAREEVNFRHIDIALLLRNDEHDYIKKAAEYWISDMFDISILNKLPVNTASRVLEEGKVLYVADPAELQRFSLKVVKEWADFKPLYSKMISAI